MFPEFGHLALILACVIAAFSSILLAIGAYRNNPVYLSVGTKAIAVQTVLITFASLTLFYAFYTVDLSVQYVALHTHHTTPWYYRLTAFWGAHEGSLLLWAWLLNLWIFIYSFSLKKISWRTQSTELAILFAVSAGLLVFILGTSNPFLRYLPLSPSVGKDLNPLLQDPGLATHPPILYIGYVGFAIAYAQALAALLLKNINIDLFKRMRNWVLAPFAFLTLGIVLGSFWAYYELGWGGFWFWDPVENASFMPWLVAVALIHCLILNINRGKYQNLSLFLAILAFAMSILGTFLVRSGAVISVHAFASSPERGIFILLYFLVFVGGAYSIYALRASAFTVLKNNSLQSSPLKERLLLLHVCITLIIFFTVLLGTLYPMILDILHIAKISIGPPYFNQILLPQVSLLLLLLPLTVLLNYSGKISYKSLLIFALSILIMAVLIYVLFINYISLKYLWLFSLLVFTLICYIKICTNKKFRYKKYLPMHLAHFGLLCALSGIALSSHLSVEKDLRFHLYDTINVGGYNFSLVSVKRVHGSNYKAFQADFIVKSKGRIIAHMLPEKRLYNVANMPITETAIAVRNFNDLYIAMGELLPNNSWSVRIYVKPYVRLIWFGGLLIAIGSIFSCFKTFGIRRNG